MPFFADERVDRHLEIVEEQLGRRVIHHRPDRTDRQAVPDRLAQVDEQHRQAVGALLDLGERRRPHDEQQQIRVLGARDPDLLAADDVAVAATDRGGLQLRRVGARGRLADAERLQPQLAGGDLGQVLALLRVGAVPQQRAHRVHLRVAGAGVGAAAVDLLEDDRRLVDAEAGAAVLLGNQRRQVAGVGQRLDERVGIRARGIELAPVAVGKVLAEIADARAQILMTVAS